MLPSPIPVSRVPGILDQLEGDDTSCTQRQTPKAPNRVQECNPESLADAERTLGFIRQNEPLLPSGSSPGTFALSCSTEALYQQRSPEQTCLEQDKGLSDRKITNRPPMVDSSHGSRIQGDLHTYSHKVLHSTSRLVCISAQSSTTSLCFPTPRTGCNGGRCNDIAMEQMDIVHSCANYNASSHSEENTRRSGNLSTHCPELARPDMVSATIGDVGQHPVPSSNDGNESVSTFRPGNATPSVENNEAGGMATFRERCRAGGLPPQVCDILMASWREGTKKRYEGPWRLWTSWCVSRNQCPFSATVAEVLQFLTEQFHTRKLSYRTVGVYKSCISQLHDPIDGQPLGTLPLLSRFMKGVFELRPPTPKICVTWSVGTLLEHLKNMEPNENLSLKELTLKTTILLPLTSSARAHELAALHLDYVSQKENGWEFVIPKHVKNYRPNHPARKIYLPSLPENQKICVIESLKQYVNRTARICKAQYLLVSYTSPHSAIGSQAVSRWIRTVLSNAGIDAQYTGHSTRAAATSMAADSGVPLEDIIAAADWSSATTFERFYHKAISKDKFVKSILAPDVQK